MEWISVNDQLPEIGNECLIINMFGGQSIARFTNRNITYGYHYKTAWFVKGSRQLSKKTITHWMPLPKPPKTK